MNFLKWKPETLEQLYSLSLSLSLSDFSNEILEKETAVVDFNEWTRVIRTKMTNTRYELSALRQFVP